jgi:hypothetical protein
MIEFFFCGALILGQALYWSFFKDQTEVVSDEYDEFKKAFERAEVL